MPAKGKNDIDLSAGFVDAPPAPAPSDHAPPDISGGFLDEAAPGRQTLYPSADPAPANLTERIGQMIPESLTPALSFAQKYVNEPLNKFAEFTHDLGRSIGEEAVTGVHDILHPPFEVQNTPGGRMLMPSRTPAESTEEAKKEFPKTFGAAGGVGGLAGGMADVRMLPFFLEGGSAAPTILRRLMSAGFSFQMLKSAYDKIPGVREALHSGDEAEATRLITEGVGDVTFGALAGAHTFSKGPDKLAEDEKAVEGEVLPPTRTTPRLPGRGPGQLALPPVTISGEPVRTFIPPTSGTGMEGRDQILLNPPGPGGEPIPLPGIPEEPLSAFEMPSRATRAFVSKPGAAEAAPTVPRSVFSPRVSPGDEPITMREKQQLIEAETRAAQLPEYLRRQAGPEAFGIAPEETQQPKSDQSEVDRSELPGGAVVDPKSLDIDFDSHPFMLDEDVQHAKERAQKGEELTALVHTDPETGRPKVVDGHGSTQAALEANIPIRAIEMPNVLGDEDIGLRAASHYLAKDKPDITAPIGDETTSTPEGDKTGPGVQNIPGLEARDEALRQQPPAIFKPTQIDHAAEIAKLHAANGGSTYNLRDGDLIGQDAYSIGAHPDRSITLDHAPSRDEIQQFMDANKDLLARPDRSVGTWDARDGRHVLDIVATLPDKNDAMSLARMKKQEAIYHLGGQGEIPVEPLKAPEVPALPAVQKTEGGAQNITDPSARATIARDLERRGITEPTHTFWRVDTRTGREYPLSGPEARNYKVKPYEITVRRDISGNETTVDQGKRAFEKLPRQGGFAFGSQRGSATPDFLSFLSSGGLSEVGKRIIDKIRGEGKDVEGWPEVARFLTPEDRARASTRLKEAVTQAVNDLGNLGDVEEAVKAGSVARGWYQRTGKLISFMFGKDANKFTDFFAALSPMKSVENNFIEALNFYSDWADAGKPRGMENAKLIRSILPKDAGVAGGVIREQLYNILVNDAKPSGPKVSNFAKNLKGEMDAVTKDRWMSYLFGKGETHLTTGGQGLPSAKHLAMDAVTRAVAKKMNMLPAEVQESGWSFVRAVVNFSEEKGISPHEAAQKITESDIRGGASEFARIISTNEKVRSALDAIADRTGNERFRVSNIEGSPKFQQLLGESERTRGIGGGLRGADRDVLGRVAERAARARSGEVEGSGAEDTSFGPAPKETRLSDALIKKFGTTDDPLKAGFILPDGRMVPLSGMHDEMLEKVDPASNYSKSEDVPDREDFINSEGAVRTRYRMSRRGEEVVFSVPEKVTPKQISQMKSAVQKVGRNGNYVMERATEGGAYDVKEFPLTRDIDISLRKLGAHPEEAPSSAEGGVGSLTENDSTLRGLINPLNAVGKAYTDLIGKRITSKINDLYNAALGNVERATGLPLKRGLRSPESFLPKKYLQSKIYQRVEETRGREEAMNIGKRLSEGLTQRTQQILMDIISGKTDDSQLKIVRSTPRLQDALDAAKYARERLNDLGAQAVTQDLLKSDTFFKNYGKYVPRLYRKFEVDYDGLLRRTGERAPSRLDLDRFKQREDIPAIVRDQMGEIREAAYPVAKGIADLTHDVSRAKFFSKISANPQWVTDKPREGWIKMPETDKLGALSGKYLDRDIAQDVNEMIKMRSEANKFFGDMMGKYKRVRVVWAPGSFVWHNLSRGFLNYLDGLPPTRVDIYAKALVDRARKGELYEMARENGVIDDTSFDPEVFNDLLDSWNKSRGGALQRMMQMGADISSKLKAGKDYQGDIWNHPWWGAAREVHPLRSATGGVSDKVVNFYSALDQWMKMAKFSHNLEKGMQPYEAGLDARKATIDYRNVPKLVDWSRRTITPFITFPTQAIPRLAKSAIEAPWRLMILYELLNAGQNYARTQLGITKEQDDQNRKLSRSQAVEGTGLDQQVLGFDRYLLLPSKDKAGRFQYLDMNHLLHWTGLGQPAAPGTLPFGSEKLGGPLALPAEILQREVYGHPLVSMFGPSMFNKDPYTGKALYGPGEEFEGPAGATASRIYKTWSPSLAPGNFVYQRLSEAARGRPDYFGRPTSLPSAAFSSLSGLNIRPEDPNAEAGFRANELKNALEDVRKGIFRAGSDQRLTEKERNEKIEELTERERKLLGRYESIYQPSGR